MRKFRLVFILALVVGLGWLIYKWYDEPNERDKVFHAGPAESGLGVIYFGLYNDGRYQFCDGDFMDPGCYTGEYQLSGDTITLLDLKKHNGLVTNRFLICRYAQMDSTYWFWKNPEIAGLRNGFPNQDTVAGATGDIWPLDSLGKPILSTSNYWVIRFDKL